jgi:hypothetical protein
MKTPIIAFLCALSTALLASGQVPSLINYQGRLTDANGAAVTGNKNFSINIFDAATAGNLLYTETIGAVNLDSNGVYSFQFGSAGTSNTQVTETVATTNGTGTTFQKVLANSPVVAGSVNITDGTYTWSQSAGSSNEDDFGVAYSTSLRRVTVNYYNGAPAADRVITATYRYGTSGITGALNSGAEHWMAISVDGTPQAARQRVLAVPFAQRAAFAQTAEVATTAQTANSALTASSANIAAQLQTQTKKWRPIVFTGTNRAGRYASGLPFSHSGNDFHGANVRAQISTEIKKITNIYHERSNSTVSQSSNSIRIERYRSDVGTEILFTINQSNASTGKFSANSSTSILLDPSFVYFISFQNPLYVDGVLHDLILTVEE